MDSFQLLRLWACYLPSPEGFDISHKGSIITSPKVYHPLPMGHPSPLPPYSWDTKKKDGIKIFRPTLQMIVLFRPRAKWAGQGNHWVRVARLWLKSGCWAYSLMTKLTLNLGLLSYRVEKQFFFNRLRSSYRRFRR